MNLVRILNYVSYVAVFSSYILTGFLISETPWLYKFESDHLFPGKPLPTAFEWFLEYSTYHKPLVVGLFEGLLFLCLLIYLERSSDQKRAFIPLWVTLALTLNLLQFLLFFGAMTQVPLTDYISQPTSLAP